MHTNLRIVIVPDVDVIAGGGDHHGGWRGWRWWGRCWGTDARCVRLYRRWDAVAVRRGGRFLLGTLRTAASFVTLQIVKGQ